MARLFCLSLVVALTSGLSAGAQENPPAKFTNSLGMDFVLVPKGKSWLGGGSGLAATGEPSPPVEGNHEVNMTRDFYLGAYLVTQEQWEKVMGKNPSSFSRTGSKKDLVKDIADADLKRFPVESVTWEEAKAFVKLLNDKVKEAGWEYRLPIEGQWEYACRGGAMADKAESAFDYYFDKPAKSLTKEQANMKDSGLMRPSKVGSYPPNRLGLYDMHGNVWEWCDDRHSVTGERMIRGGSFAYNTWTCRAAHRHWSPPDIAGIDCGFRVARVPSAGK